MGKLKTFLKRTIATIGIIGGILLISKGSNEFGRADEWIEIFKAFFWIIIGAGGMVGFIDDFKEKKWLFQSHD